MMNIDFDTGYKLSDYPNVLNKYPVSHYSLINPQDARIKNDILVKFLEIKVNGTDVLLLFKCVKIMKSQFVRLLHTPISIDKNIALENAILKTLSKHPQIKQLVTTEEDLLLHSLPLSKDIYAYDFYSVLEDKHKEVNRGKHKSKIKYTKYKDRITFMRANATHYDAISHILSSWMSNKIDNEGLYNKKTFMYLLNNYFDVLEDPNLFLYVTLFDNIPVAFELFSSQGDILYQLVNQAYPTLDYYVQLFDDISLAKDIFAYAHKWQHLLSINVLQDKFRLINYGYAKCTSYGLLYFKNTLYKDKHVIHRCNFKYYKYFKHYRDKGVNI